MFNNINAASMLTSLATKAKAFAAGVTEIELKVLEATNEDKWGPHGNDMKEIARAAEDPENRALIMNTIWQRLRETDANWRLCYKAMLLCEYLIKQGPMRCVDELQRGAYVFERLRDNFHYKDQDGRDQGINVRQRGRELAALLSSSAKIQEEREKARANAGKYKGVSASDMRGGGGGTYSGYGSSGGGGFSSSHQHSYSSGGNYQGSGGQSGLGGSHSAGHSRTNSTAAAAPPGGSNLRPPSGARGGAGEEAEDPFEATRRRIERLKAQEKAGQEAGTGADDGHVPVGSINMDASSNLFPEAKPRMGPKKLSDVKVDPAITAAFGGALAPPPPSGSVVKGSVSRLPAPGSALNGGSIDLLGGGTGSSPSTTPPPAPAQGAAQGGIDWDGLEFAPAPAAAPPAHHQQMDSLFGAPAAPSQPPAAAPLDLFGFDAPAAPAAAGGAGGCSDPFGGAAAGLAPAAQLAPPPAAAAGRPAAPAAAAFPDPFAAAPAPAKAAAPMADFSDPFSALPMAAPKPAPVADLFSSPMSAPPAPKPALAADLFGDPFASAPAPKPVMPAAGGMFSDPFAAVPAAVSQPPAKSQPQLAADLFADPFQSAPAAPSQQPFNDPFSISANASSSAVNFGAFATATPSVPAKAFLAPVASPMKPGTLGAKPKASTDPFADLLN